jgi:hypothetical protein
MSPTRKKPAGSKVTRNVPSPTDSLPQKLLIGDFELTVEQIAIAGKRDLTGGESRRVSGTAWLRLGCATAFPLYDPIELPDGYRPLKVNLEVVHAVKHPDTQISFEDAHLLNPRVQVGQMLELKLGVTVTAFHDIAKSAAGILETLKTKDRRGDFLVGFDKVTIEAVPGRKGVWRIIQGEVLFPGRPHYPREIRLDIDGFTVVISALRLRPTGTTARASLILPQSIAQADTCGRATLPLGEIVITPDCDIYVEKPADAFGPWLIGDTGLLVSGTGYTVDLSDTRSPALMPPAWKGVLLAQGTASGAALNPADSNTGYLAAEYRFGGAAITKTGFQARIELSARHAFRPVNPQGYAVGIDDGFLVLTDSGIAFGQLGPGIVRFPTAAVCSDRPGSVVEVRFTTLDVEPDLDLSGGQTFPGGSTLTWGELTRAGDEATVWCVEPGKGRLYLPADPVASFCPDDGTGFSSPTLADLEPTGVSGVTAYDLRNLTIFSPDRPGGVANPLQFLQPLQGWLRVGCKGLDGEILSRPALNGQPLGEPARFGYVGRVPFQADISSQEKQLVIGQYVASAVYDSQVDGRLKIPAPCDIPNLVFRKMELTSTAHLVGGSIVLPVGGVTLDYWKLQLVPTGDPSQAGVVSARTGRLVFTAAGISEPVHFAQPVKLTWGEMLADGNLGELFIDFNSYGQKFDGLPFTPGNLVLSRYSAGRTDGYLAVCGTAHLNFFGTCFVNVRDARNEASPGSPWFGRHVTVPKVGEPACAKTDLTLHGRVDNSASEMLGIFDFPDVTMDYHVAAQDGFIGKGTSELGFLQSDSMESFIEIHRGATDIRIAASSNHDLDLGFYRAGTLGRIAGCVRIEGPLLRRISMWAALEQSAQSGFGILEPKAGYGVEVNLDITPSSLNFYLAGNIVFSVAGSAVDLAASVHLLVDYLRSSAEGEINGALDCNSILGGLEGSGQVTWYVDASTQVLQGRLKMTVAGWAGGVGMEGGLFIGNNCPKQKAWVLQTGSEHFGVSQAILPDSLTGVFGYGYASFGINWYIFGGGVELFAGLGAFVESPPGGTSAWVVPVGLGLPYVVGTAGVHVYGEILGGLVSAAAWADLDLRGPIPIYFEGTFGLEGCVLWVICASIEVTAGLNSSGFYLN